MVMMGISLVAKVLARAMVRNLATETLLGVVLISRMAPSSSPRTESTSVWTLCHNPLYRPLRLIYFAGVAFRDIKGDKFFPAVGMKKPGEHVKVNFGQEPFAFDIDGLVAVSAFYTSGPRIPASQ